MKKILRLMRVEVSNNLDPRRLTERRKKGLLVGRGGGIFIILLLAFCVFFYAFFIAKQAADAGAPQMVLLVFILLDTLVTLIYSVSSGSARMLKATNLDVLISMPFSGFQLYCGKLGAFLVENYVYSAFFMIPAFVAYAYYAMPSLLFIPAAIMVFLVVPMLPIGVGLLISTLLSFVPMKKNKSKVIRNVIAVLAFVVCYFAFISKSASFFAYLFTNPDVIISAVGKYYPPAVWGMKGAMLEWMQLLLFTAASFVLFVLVAFIVSVRFKRSVGKLNASEGSKGGKVTEYKASSSFSSLFRKEVTAYFGSSVYFINTSLGMMLIVTAAIYFAFSLDAESIAGFNALAQIIPAFASAVMIVPMFAMGISCTTVSSISFEGRALAIIKSMPIRTKDIFAAKIALNMLVLCVPTVILTVIITAVGVIDPIDLLLTLVGTFFFAVFVSFYGLLVNLRHPKLEWTTEASVVKQSAAVGIMMGIGMASTFAFGVAFWYFGVKLQFSKYAMFAVLDGAAAALALASVLLLKKNGERLYNEL